MQGVLDQPLLVERIGKTENDSFGQKIGFIATLFGCWHKRLTRPFSNKNDSYLACLDCGARRKVDMRSFRASRAFYYPPSVTLDRNRANT